MHLRSPACDKTFLAQRKPLSIKKMPFLQCVYMCILLIGKYLNEAKMSIIYAGHLNVYKLSGYLSNIYRARVIYPLKFLFSLLFTLVQFFIQYLVFDYIIAKLFVYKALIYRIYLKNILIAYENR